MENLNQAKLYGILDLGYVEPTRAPAMAKLLIEGGVDILQLRAKGAGLSVLVPLAIRVGALCRAAKIPFIVNDHPEVARESGADGVHVGQDDLSVAEARAISGSRIVGKSTHSVDQAEAARAEAPDYIGFGPLFATPTKPDYRAIGLSDIAAVVRSSPFPVFCIGGIKPDNLPQVVAAGANRVVIVSGLLLADDVRATCRACRNTLP